jgi:hypothetical protein
MYIRLLANDGLQGPDYEQGDSGVSLFTVDSKLDPFLPLVWEIYHSHNIRLVIRYIKRKTLHLQLHEYIPPSSQVARVVGY